MNKIKIILSITFLINFSFSESDLLRSKYLTDEMINDIEKLDSYSKKSRIIFNKYEKAKFYQMVSYTYFIKYQNMVKELESLERHYYSIFSNYKEDSYFNSINKEINSPGIQNEFTPILFTKQSPINIKLFKAKAKMFKKQYHDYLEYFNNKVNLYNDKLIRLKKSNTISNEKHEYTKIYNDYNNFLLGIEAIDKKEQYMLNTVIDTNSLISEINWKKDNNFPLYTRKLYYLKNSENIKKMVDFENEKIILITNYSIDLNSEFIQFILLNNMIKASSLNYGSYSISNYNKFEKPIKTTYYSVNNDIIGVIIKNYDNQNTKLISENWYIGNYHKKIKGLKIIFDPKTNKNIWVEERYQ